MADFIGEIVMSYPYAYEVHFGSEHSFSDCVVVPKVGEDTSNSDNTGDDPNDDPNDDQDGD